MWHYLAKIGLTAIIVVSISEIAKRSSFFAAVLASLPLLSLLAFVWLYVETGDVQRVASLSQGVFWMVIPSLPLFLLLPVLLQRGWNFWLSLTTVCVVTIVMYAAMIWLLGKIGIQI